MAQRFHLDLTDGLTTIRDEDGVLAPNLSEAIRQAEEVLEEMRRSGDLSSRDKAWTLIIRDAAGERVMALSVIPSDPDTALAS